MRSYGFASFGRFGGVAKTLMQRLDDGFGAVISQSIKNALPVAAGGDQAGIA
jgi:hypothetical protein